MSGRRGIPRSSSTTRAERKRSARSSGACGTCRWTSAPRSRPTSRRRSPFSSSSSASPARAPSLTVTSSRRSSPTRSPARSPSPRPMTWRRENERTGRGVRALPAGPGSGGRARVPVRARAGRSLPHQTVAQAARVARSRGREGGRAARDRRRRRGGGAHRPRRDRAPADGGQEPPPRRQGGAPRGGGRTRRVKAERGWHRSVTGIARRTFEAAFEDNIPFLASALSFDLLLTIIPFVALLLATVGYLVQHQITTQQVELHELLARLLPSTAGGVPDRAFTQVESALASVVRQRVRLTAVGLPLFLWFSTRLFGGLRAALNEVFDTDERRSWPIAKVLDLAMVFCTGTLLVLGALVATWEARNAGSVSRSFAIDWLWRLSLELTSFALGVALFFVIFKFLPSRRIVWRTALVAAVFCSLGFEVAKRLYALYVTRFATLDRVASDANIVALFLFLLWVYYTAYLFLLGGEVAEMYDLVRMQRSQRVQLG